MTNVEAGLTEGRVLGEELAKVYAHLWGRYDLMHDTIKGIAKSFYSLMNDGKEPNWDHIKNMADSYWEAFKSEKNVKKKTAEKVSVWSSTVVTALEQVYNCIENPVERLHAESKILGGAAPYWNWLCNRVDDFYCTVSENFLDETADCEENLKKYQKALVDIYNSDLPDTLKVWKAVDVLLKLVRDVFVWCEDQIA